MMATSAMRKAAQLLNTSVSRMSFGAGRSVWGRRAAAQCSTAASASGSDSDGTAAQQSDRTPVPEPKAASGSQVEKHQFQTETKQLLDIVANALYTDRHVFVRELISNSSDACEKVRHKLVTGDKVVEADGDLSIRMYTDDTNGTLTIIDNGIGMSREEMMQNLGTIAHSGSKQFVETLKAQREAAASGDSASNVIGQFGVGFYSAFMVADEISVFSRSADPAQDGETLWHSLGDGAYDLQEADGMNRGTKIELKLKDSCRDFSNPATVEDIIKRYSNFVNFPIFLNDKQVNTVQALWTLPKSEVTPEQYEEFYKYKAKAYDKPMMTLHFAADAPIELKVLLFVGQVNEEGFGLGRQRPGVDLYSRKVLIEPESKIMPEWLRFMQGVVDSEDIPLNVSREFMQDSALMRRIRTVLTRRVLRFLETEMKRNRKGYEKFFAEHGTYLKEGACAEQIYQNDIGKLLLFESSELPAGKLTTLDEYVSRTAPGQSQIYYLVAPHRGLAEKSPYMESFKANKTNGNQSTEVLYLYQPIDDFVMDNLKAYNGRQLITIESSDIKMNHIDQQAVEKEAAKTEEEEGDTASAPLPGVSSRLAEHQVRQLSDWLMNTALPRRLKAVKASSRLVSTPAVITDHESSSMRRMMRMLDMQQRDSEAPRSEESMLPKQTLEINPSHPVICRLHALSTAQPTVAVLVAEQLFDNTLMAAGLMDDSRTMLPRLTTLMETLLGSVIERDAASAGGRIGVDLDSEGKGMRHETAEELHQKATTEAAHDSAMEAALRAKIAGETGGLKDVPDFKSGTVGGGADPTPER